MARDGTARTRIRDYLATRGPIEELSGHATSDLMEAIDYKGSPVAFIQLIASMDKDGEIVREIRGKRTYRISATDEVVAAVAGKRARAGRSVEVPGQPVAEIDYQKLARALLHELLGAVASGASAPADPGPADADRDRERIIAERNEYARRLEAAREKLGELLGGVGEGAAGRPDDSVFTVAGS